MSGEVPGLLLRPETRDDALAAFYIDPYKLAAAVEHETRDEPAPDFERTGLVRVANDKRFIGLVERRNGNVDEMRGDAAKRGELLVAPQLDGRILEPRDRFAMQRGDAAYRDSLILDDEFYIAWRLTLPRSPAGQIDRDALPLFVFLHGVPTNMSQMQEVHRRVAQYAPVLRFDMLGMGRSDKPRFYRPNTDEGRRELRAYLDGELSAEQIGVLEGLRAGNGVAPRRPWDDAWQWQNDVGYIDELVRAVCASELLGRNRNRKFIFVADDWGGGQLAHYAARFDRERLLGVAFLDPIAFDGYPVHEIQAIGRSSHIGADGDFMRAQGAADQTMVQIFKTMVYDNTKMYNQYSLRALVGPYASQEYLRLGAGSVDRDGVPAQVVATSGTMQLNFHALRVLADRSAILSSALLMPRVPGNEAGVDYSRITVPALVMWGEFDNMMPELQRYRFQYLVRGPVQHVRIPRAGHFAGDDNPDAVAARLLNWTMEYHGPGVFQRAFFGFDGIRKGDEALLGIALGAALRRGLFEYDAYEPLRARLVEAAKRGSTQRDVDESLRVGRRVLDGGAQPDGAAEATVESDVRYFGRFRDRSVTRRRDPENALDHARQWSAMLARHASAAATQLDSASSDLGRAADDAFDEPRRWAAELSDNARALATDARIASGKFGDFSAGLASLFVTFQGQTFELLLAAVRGWIDEAQVARLQSIRGAAKQLAEKLSTDDDADELERLLFEHITILVGAPDGTRVDLAGSIVGAIGRLAEEKDILFTESVLEQMMPYNYSVPDFSRRRSRLPASYDGEALEALYGALELWYANSDEIVEAIIPRAVANIRGAGDRSRLSTALTAHLYSVLKQAALMIESEAAPEELQEDVVNKARAERNNNDDELRRLGEFLSGRALPEVRREREDNARLAQRTAAQPKKSAKYRSVFAKARK